MYDVPTSPYPVAAQSPALRARYDIALSRSNRAFARVKPEFERYQALVARDAGDPLTGLERLALAAVCTALADTFAEAAVEWSRCRPRLAITSQYRATARRFRDEAALHEAVAVIAPSHRTQDGPARSVE